MKKSEPAFPVPHQNRDGSIQHDVNLGISKRFYAACAAMQGLLASDNEFENIREVIKDAYLFADELIKQENNESKTNSVG